MNNNGKINHIFKLVGILLILISMTVLAHSEEYRFDCTDEFNCSVKSYCQDVSNAVSGLLVSNGDAYSYANGTEPTEYAFTSSQPGPNVCSLTVQVSAMHNQNQLNEKTAVYINEQYLGTTTDNYCNGPDDEECTFCSIDSQYLGQFNINLQENNTLRIHGYDSHALVAVIVDCVPQYDPNSCYYNVDPRIEEIENEEMSYNNSIRIDLWNYIRDGDDRLTDLEINVNTNNQIFDCSLDENRYLNCEVGQELGTTDVTINVDDGCEVASETFSLTSVNNPPVINVPNREESCSANLNKIIDLRYYSSDEDLSLADFNLLSQTNQSIIDCNLDSNYYISCIVNSCATDYTDLNVEITDIFGLTDTDVFRINIKDYDPEWISIPSICINTSTEVFDLKDFSTDREDGNNLDFEIIDQNDYVNIDCEIVNDSIVDCEVKTNNHTATELKARATDSSGNEAEKEFIIETNCETGNTHTITSENKGMCLENCTSYTEDILIKNNSEEEKCYDLELDYDGYLNAELTNEKFCLNKNEETTAYLNIITCGADEDYYEIKVMDRTQDLSILFDLEIGSCSNFDGFRIEEYDGTICQGEEREFTVEVTNTTDYDKEILLSAENQHILPYFSREEIYVEENDSKYVGLTINAKHAPLGKQNVFLKGIADNYLIEKRMIVDVKDCSNIKERNFIISAPDICFDVTKGQIFQGSFNVKRIHDGCVGCSFDEKGVSLALYGMQNELSDSILYLTKGEERKVYYTVKVPIDAKAGANFLTIKGEELADAPFDDEIGFIDDKEICLNVEGTSNSNIRIRTSSKVIEWCDSEIFELEIINDGDFDETFDLSIIDSPKGVTANFSEDIVTVAKGSSKIVYIVVATSPESEIRDNQSIKIEIDGYTKLYAKIYFDIKEKLGFTNVEILSNTQTITTKVNQETEYSIELRNNSERTYRNLKVNFENVPMDMNIETKIIDELIPGQVINLSGKIISKVDGNYSLVFVIETRTLLLNKKAFNIIVEKQDSSELAGLAGLFSLGSIDGLFSLGAFSLPLVGGLSLNALWLMFLIVLIGIIILGILLTQKQVHYEQWVEAKK